MLIQHPKSIERMRKKFENTNTNFNLYFVNSPTARKYKEIGVVDLQFVKDNLGDEIATAIQNGTEYEDSINVIFTNNDGSERMPFTAWIAAHRLGHAFARRKGAREHYTQYMSASNHLISQLSTIMDGYGIKEFPDSENKISRSRYGSGESARKNQLAMLHFFYNVATFKSARDKNIRDWFEVLNELIAQYLTTGTIKFNPPPKSFGGRDKYWLRDDAAEDVADLVDSLSRDMEFMIDDILSSVGGEILIM